MLQKLKTQFKQRIKEDQELQLKIAKLLGKRNIVTVQRWIGDDNPLLTIPGVLDIIREHIGLEKDVELTEAKENAIA
jgi:hypothetical protein